MEGTDGAGARLEAQAREFDAAITGLVKLYQFRDRAETVAYGLSVSQAYALRALGEGGPLSMGALARELRLSISAATRVVDPLAARGLVTRRAGDRDRRVRTIALTAAGGRLWRRLHREILVLDAGVLAQLPARERDAVIGAVRRLGEATVAWRASKRSRRGAARRRS